jgi:acetyl esterase/lipase
MRISPALDPSLANPEIADVEPTDPWLNRAGVRVFAEVWRGDLPLADPRVSPIFGEIGGLGPITLFVGTRDIVFPDSRRFAGLARAAGVTIDYHERAGLIHVYPLLPTAEGSHARRLIVDRVRAAVSQPVATA